MSEVAMAILPIKQYPDFVLRQECAAVEEILGAELALFEDMLATMHGAQGIGLAAPQVGVNRKIIVVDIGEGPLKLANPKIIKSNKTKEVMGEGCLSVPNTVVDVARPSEIIIVGLDEKGKTVELKAKGLLARVIMHEIDHINGRLIVDYMNFFKKIDYKLKSRKKT
ncbi:MAG: peptide deformylase [Candidatus Omnitrophota bacterium]